MSGAVVYETPLVASSRRLSVVHGTGARRPADHWLVDCVHTPETGFCTNVSGALGGRRRRAASFAGAEVEPRRRQARVRPVRARLPLSGAEHVLRHLRDRGNVRLHPLQVLVEPAQRDRVEARDAALGQAGSGRPVGVRPRADQEARGHVTLQPLVDERLAALEDVVLAADDEGRVRGSCRPPRAARCVFQPGPSYASFPAMAWISRFAS